MGHGLRRRCREGVLAGRILLNYVVWGNGSVSARLWNAIRSDDWAIPHVSLSSLGEIVVWARPDDDFPEAAQANVRNCPVVAAGSVSARLWNAIRSDDWAIPHVSLSSLGEIVVWARPDEFPPRNMQTSKGLRALGYNVRIGV